MNEPPMYVQTYVCMHVHAYMPMSYDVLCMYVFMYVCMHACMDGWMYVCMYVICKCTYM